MDLNVPFSACDVKKVRAIEFGTFDPEFIKRLSVCEITNVELYEEGIPKAGGLNDPRMGTTDHRIQCKSCGMDCKTCPGHFGHINLSKPVYHVGFLGVILSVLHCVCYSCSRILADYDNPRFLAALRVKNPKARLAAILACCRGKKRCEGNSGEYFAESRGSCGAVQPTYTRDNVSIVVKFPVEADEVPKDPYDETTREDSKRHLTPEEAISVLRRISNDDLKILGFDPKRSVPSWMVITSLLVVPPTVRPYVQFGIDRSEDDLTLKLLDILKTNIQIKKQEEAGVPAHIIQETEGLLQFHVATLFNNEIPGLPVAATKAKKPIKSLRERLKGKEGRFRGNLMGKRVDFSARTVISGDPNLMLDEVGVPISIAMNLTFPEIVTCMNLETMKKRVANGHNTWPGARYIILPDGTRFDLRHCHGNPSVLHLEPGYKVERHMQDGDFVLFNRQPSLHKMSIMGHRVKVLPWATFRVNLAVTKPYNADFDGDEMNLHIAQSHETRAEIKHLALVPKQIVSPQGNKPVMGIVQDSLVGISKLTKRDTFIPKDLLMNLVMWIPYWKGKLPPPAILRPVELWTGKQIITLLLAFDGLSGSSGNSKWRNDAVASGTINLVRDSAVKQKGDTDTLNESDGTVIIRNSEHLAGVICNRTAGSSSGSLVHVLYHDNGPEKTKHFLSSAQKVVNNWLLTQGFSVGVGDMIASDKTLESVKLALMDSSKRVDDLIMQARKGQLETQPGKSLIESLESRVNQELNQAREAAGKIAAESLSDKNNMIAMMTSGSKGSTINVSQIMACVGQQNVEGKRIGFGFKDRALPHFVKFDYSPEARGFVTNSYLRGLHPHEVFFHAMGGREGIIDTACKTSETGYIQRRLIKAMEDITVTYDRTVRSSAGDIIQFLYGEDGMSGEFIEDQFLHLIQTSYQQMEHLYKHDYENPKYGESWISDLKLREELQFSYEKHAILDCEWEELMSLKKKLCTEIYIDGDVKQHIPCNIARLIQFAKSKFVNEGFQLPLSPVDIIQKVEHLLTTQLQQLFLCSRNPSSNAQEAFKNSVVVFNAHVRTHLNSRKILEHDKLGPQAFDWVIGEIFQQFQKALVHPGEVVGALAAQSIGEPATQMTLNTFHFAGVSSKNVTLGVPRLKELINVSKVVKTPSLTVYLEDKVSKDQEIAKSVQTHLEHTSLEKITSFAEVIYDPDPTTSIVPNDKQWVQEYYEFPDDEDINPARLGRWVLRIQLLDQLIIDKQLTMKEIGQRIVSEFANDELELLWTDDNAEELVLRIRLKLSPDQAASKSLDPEGFNAEDLTDKDHDENVFLTRLMSQCLVGITLRGIQDITKVYMREEKSPTFDPVTGKFSLQGGRWVLDTEGCNLQAVLAAPLVSSTYTTSNSILEILSVLGIEATRKALLRELRAVISFDGSYVNYRHLSMLCDVMTQRGNLMPITRNGINRVDRGCLAKCSFEETVEILLQAAAFAESDYLRGVTERVMIGQMGKFGTGVCDIMIDDEKLKDPALHFETSSLQQLNGTGQMMDGSSIVSPLDSPVSSISSSSPKSLKHFVMSPFSPNSPSSAVDLSISSPLLVSQFSPLGSSPLSPQSPMSPSAMYPMSPGGVNMFSPTNTLFSPFVNPQSPSYSPSSPIYGGTSSATYSPASPIPSHVQINSPLLSPTYSPTSPAYSPTSPTYSPSSPTYSPASPTYSPTHPAYSPTSPAYSPTSPAYSPTYSPSSPNYSPGSPPYSPTSPPGVYSPQSPAYSPMSPGIGVSISSPGGPGQLYSPNAAVFGYGSVNPQSPGAYSPTAMSYSPTLGASPRQTTPMSPLGMQSPRFYGNRED